MPIVPTIMTTNDGFISNLTLHRSITVYEFLRTSVLNFSQHKNAVVVLV